jgi:hypothetical protein
MMTDRAWADAATASKRIERLRNRTFADWLSLARGLHAARQQLIAETGVQSDASPIFARALAEWVKTHKWAAPFMGDGKSSFRSACYALIENEAAIAEWRASLSEADRARWIHPEVVMRAFRQTAKGATKADSKLSLTDRAAALQMKNVALRREAREAEARAKAAEKKLAKAEAKAAKAAAAQ